MKVIIAAAQTGGHINPGIAIANKIKKEDQDSQILFVGTDRGIENDLVPKEGYELKTIEAYGINRKISFKNISNIFKTIKGFKSAKKIIKEYKPDVVIGTGGFICGPVLMAAYKYKIPTIIHESNAFPGVTTKLLSGKVNTILLGFADAAKRLKKAKNIVITGTPTKIKKTIISNNQRQELIDKLSLRPNLPIVLVFGGSQGAKTINETLINIITNKLNNNYQIIWASGQNQYNIIKEKLLENKMNIDKLENVKILPYIYNMEEIMNLSDIIISRSGAMTTTEVSITGKPAIFIPYPFATENHQEYNARVLADKKAAKIILDKDLNAEILTKTLEKMLNNKDELLKMGEEAEKNAIKNVDNKIYAEIKKIIKD